jgi:divalent metal cation (Fe/Co/Zn/Cd) transporter
MRAVRVGMWSHLLACVKGIAGIVGNSYALVADAIESAADVSRP